MKVKVLAAVGAALLAGSAHAQSITGSITYDGKVPTLKPIAMDADPACARKHTGPVPSEVLVLGTGNTLANVMVSITKGPVIGKPATAPTTPAVLDQKGCKYTPHVLGVMVKQPIKILNGDGILHNVHGLPKVNTPFNQAMPPNMTETILKDATLKEEGIFTVKCDVHPWMQAFVRVFAHPYFSVSGADGKFAINNLEPGTYEVEAWHEKLGTQTQSVTVAGKEAKAITFKFAPPAAK